MQVTIDLPDDIADRLRTKRGDLPRVVLETLAIDGYRSGELTDTEMMRLLGLNNRMQVDELLRKSGVMLDYTRDDLERDLRNLDELGI